MKAGSVHKGLVKGKVSGIGNMKNKNPRARVLLYYKSTPIENPSRYPKHTNEHEIRMIASALVELGCIVDVLDKAYAGPLPKETYELILLLGTGQASHQFEKLSDEYVESKKVLIATHPHPRLELRNYDLHFARFEERHGFRPPPVTYPSPEIFDKRLQECDAVFAYGPPGTFGFDSFVGERLPVFQYPATSLFQIPAYDLSRLLRGSRKKNRFVSYTGKGLVIKGVDLLVEFFLKNPALELDIFGPENDLAFNNYLLPLVRKSQNITFHGFLRGGRQHQFSRTRKSSFFISASPSDGAATSAITMAGFGKPVIATVETGVPDSLSLGNLGAYNSGIESAIEKEVHGALALSSSAYDDVAQNVLDATRQFDPTSFRRRVMEILRQMLDQLVP